MHGKPVMRPNGVTAPGNPSQRVHNAYHHLSDCSLPLELWNDETELAAIVHLLLRYPLWEAADRYARTLLRYLDWNRRFDTQVEAVSEAVAKARVFRVFEHVSLQPHETSAAALYVSMLESGFAERMARAPSLRNRPDVCYT
jgi:hypothetical protein